MQLGADPPSFPENCPAQVQPLKSVHSRDPAVGQESKTVPTALDHPAGQPVAGGPGGLGEGGVGPGVGLLPQLVAHLPETQTQSLSQSSLLLQALPRQWPGQVHVRLAEVQEEAARPEHTRRRDVSSNAIIIARGCLKLQRTHWVCRVLLVREQPRREQHAACGACVHAGTRKFSLSTIMPQHQGCPRN